MPNRLEVVRGGLRLRSAVEPPADTGVVTFRRGRGSLPVCIDVVERLWRFYGGDLQISDEALNLLQDQRAWHNESLDLQQEEPPEMHPALWDYQQTAAHWLRDMSFGILADEQGTGKSPTALVASLSYPDVVIVCSNTKKDEWAAHVTTWCVGSLSWRLEGDRGDREAILTDWTTYGGYLVCNYDQIVDHEKQLWHAKCLILDEAHKVRNRKSEWRKVLGRLTKDRQRAVYCLTANPEVNTPLDIWTLLSLVDGPRFRSFWSFVYRFYQTSSNGFGIEIGGVKPHEQVNLDHLIAPYIMRRTREQVGLKVPEAKRRVVRHEMSGLQRSLYDDLLNDGEATFGDVMCEAWLAIQRITRLRQIALDPQIIWADYDGPSKTQTLVKVVEERRVPTLVFFMLDEAACLATKALQGRGLRVGHVSGQVSASRRALALLAFAEGTLDVLCLTHGTGGEGLNVPAAERVILMELAWHAAGNKQAQDRAIRPTNEAKEVEVIVVHVPGSVEDHIWDIVKHKGRVTINELIRRENLNAYRDNGDASSSRRRASHAGEAVSI